jgi:hypothetical protein
MVQKSVMYLSLEVQYQTLRNRPGIRREEQGFVLVHIGET